MQIDKNDDNGSDNLKKKEEQKEAEECVDSAPLCRQSSLDNVFPVL